MTIKTIEELRLNEFKLKIIRQLKDPYSAFNCLLSRPIEVVRARRSRNNLAKNDITMRISEFDMFAKFIWSPLVSFDQGTNVLFPYADGAHQVVFNTKDRGPVSFDLSDKDALNRIKMHEEVIIPSPKNHNMLILGIRGFYIDHNDYEFFRVYSDELAHSIEFDVVEQAFSGDLSGVVGAWDYCWRLSRAKGKDVYIEYLHTDAKHHLLLNHLSGIEADDKVKHMILRAIKEEWYNEQVITRLGMTAQILEASKNQ